VLQYACNELGIARLRYISKLQEEYKPSFKLQNGKQVYEPSGSAFQQLLKAVGLVPISDEEYLARLKRTRDVHLKRMVQLEKQVEEEKNSKMDKS
jgi:spore coat protein CotH